jgi:ribosomal protein L11 methyltransferase
LVYYFYDGDSIHEKAEVFAEFVKNEDITNHVEVVEKPWDDWNQEWRKHYSEINVHDELVVIPEWEKENTTRDDSECIFIYPGMGFGTGEHQTTYLCLKLFMEILPELKSEHSCLDFGCGSGILGIAAIKKLNMPIVFCDIDPLALNNTLQNLELNFEGRNLSGTSLVSREKFKVDRKHQIVFANILENVLLIEKDVLLTSLEEEGYLIISGLLNHQVDGIIKEYDSLKMVSTLTKDDWSAILFQKI